MINFRSEQVSKSYETHAGLTQALRLEKYDGSFESVGVDPGVMSGAVCMSTPTGHHLSETRPDEILVTRESDYTSALLLSRPWRWSCTCTCSSSSA